MAIKIDWSVYPDRERRSAFTERLTPESPLRSAGVTIPDVKALAKKLDDDDIEIVFIEDVILKASSSPRERSPSVRRQGDLNATTRS